MKTTFLNSHHRQTENEPPAVRFIAVSKQYGFVQAVKDFSLSIHKGSITALLGPNGAGKSTTIGLMLGVLSPSAGQVQLLGQDPREPRHRRSIGAMLQDIGAPDTLRVCELIELWSSYYPHPLPLTVVLHDAGLAEIANRRFGKLSGGQRRRVAFGLALCGDPEVLVLDEPSAGLDPVARSLLWQQIRDFARHGRTVVLSTHHLEEADALADRIVLINQGQIVADGPPAQIKARVGGKRIRCRTSLAALDIHNVPGVLSVDFEGQFVQLLTDQPEQSVRRLLLLDPDLSDLEINGIGLEEAFLQLTQPSSTHHNSYDD